MKPITITSTSNKTDMEKKSRDRKVTTLIINRNKIYPEKDQESFSLNSDTNFRSPIKPFKKKNKLAENTFCTSPNRYAPLENSQIDDIQNSSNKSQQQMETESDNIHEKILSVFIINIIDFIKLREQISPLLHNDFNATNKNNKIKINLETINDFRAITKYLEEKNTNTTRIDSKVKRTSLL